MDSVTMSAAFEGLHAVHWLEDSRCALVGRLSVCTGWKTLGTGWKTLGVHWSDTQQGHPHCTLPRRQAACHKQLPHSTAAAVAAGEYRAAPQRGGADAQSGKQKRRGSARRCTVWPTDAHSGKQIHKLTNRSTEGAHAM